MHARAGRTSRVLRIIAGRHRGRRLRFPAGVDIRPTPDRVRETLFNWLQPRIDQARVLDLFAGSGALGLEALSRGAAHVTFVEQDRRAAAAIEALAREWQETAARVACADALAWLAARGAMRHSTSCSWIRLTMRSCSPPPPRCGAHGWLAPDARVYLERRAREPLPDTARPAGESCAPGRAGEVGYHLFAT